MQHEVFAHCQGVCVCVRLAGNVCAKLKEFGIHKWELCKSCEWSLTIPWRFTLSPLMTSGGVVTPLCACVSSGVGADHVVRVHKKQQGLIKHGRSVKIDFVWLSLF